METISQSDTHIVTEALQLMKRALELLDTTSAPAEIGAYLDMALTRLQEAVVRVIPPEAPAAN